MSKLVEIAPQTIEVQKVTLVFGRHAGEDGVEGEGTAFVQVFVPKKDPDDDQEMVAGSTVFLNDDGTVQSEVEHQPPAPLDNPPDPQTAGHEMTRTAALEEATV